MRPAIDFWFDFSCPYAYLASTRIEGLAERTGAHLLPKPMLLGGVFKARGVAQNLTAEQSEAKSRYLADDRRRYAALLGVPLLPAPPQSPPAPPRPPRTVGALRALLAAGEPFLPLAHAIFRAYWAEGVPIDTGEGLASVLTAAGFDAAKVLAEAQSDRIKQELFRRTDEAIGAGVFGAPAFVADGVLYWGQDRMDDLEIALGGAPPDPIPAAAGTMAPVDLHFDYQSQYSFLAAERAPAIFGAALRYRPMLLGAVFKAVKGEAYEPVNEAKLLWRGADFRRQAVRANIRTRWPTAFPARMQLPLRVTVLAGSPPELVRRLFRAYWRDDQDISDPRVVEAVAREAGLDGADLIARAELEEGKNALREATQAAIDRGVFGAPTFVVHPHGGTPSLYWGNDRLEMAARAALGDARVF